MIKLIELELLNKGEVIQVNIDKICYFYDVYERGCHNAYIIFSDNIRMTVEETTEQVKEKIEQKISFDLLNLRMELNGADK